MSGHVDRYDCGDQNKDGKTEVCTGVQHPGRSTFQEMRNRIEQQQHFQGFSYKKGNEYRRQRQLVEKLPENQPLARVQSEPQHNLKPKNTSHLATGRSQSDTTPIYANIDATIRPPQFPRVVCEKFSRNQKIDDPDKHQSTPQRPPTRFQRLQCEKVTRPKAELNLGMDDSGKRQFYITNEDDKDHQTSPIRSAEFLKSVNEKLAQNHLKNFNVKTKLQFSKSEHTVVSKGEDDLPPVLPLKSRTLSSNNLLQNEENDVTMCCHQVGLDHIDPPYDLPIPQHQRQKNSKGIGTHREISNPIPVQDTIPHIKSPEFRPLTCDKLVQNQNIRSEEFRPVPSEKLVQNQKNEGLLLPMQDTIPHIKPPEFRPLPCEKLVQNQQNEGLVEKQEKPHISRPTVIEHTPFQGRRCEEKLSQPYMDHVPDGGRYQRNEDDVRKLYNPNLGTAMQNFRATKEALEKDLKQKTWDVNRTADDVINEKITSEKKTIRDTQDPITNNQNVKIARKSSFLSNNIDKSRPTSYLTIQEVESCSSKKREQALNFKIEQKLLKSIISSLNDRSMKPTHENNKSVDNLLENVADGQEIYVTMNLRIKDKDTQRQTRGINRLTSTMSSYSEMSDRSYVSAIFPSHLHDADYMDMSGKRGSVTKVIIEKEFNMPDGKDNGAQSSFKIGSKTYYDQDLNPRIEKIYCSVPGLSEETKPKYQYVIEELLKTEYNYLMGLHHLYQDYVLYFRKYPTKRIIHMQVLFGMIEDLYKLQNTFYSSLNEHVDNVDDLAKCFIANEKLFYLYENYILTMNIAKRPMDCTECQADITNRQRELGTPLSFQNYLLTPLQRLTRYVLLLEKLNTELKAEGYDCGKLKNVMDFLKTLVESTNVDIEVIQAIKNIPDNITKFGRFIMKDVFSLKKKYSPMKCMVFLFQEVVIFTVETDPMTYVYKGSVSMNSVYIRAIAENPLCFELLDFNNCSGPNFTFQDLMNSQYQKNLFSLEAQNPKIKDVWVEVIESLLWEQLMWHKKNGSNSPVVRERLL